MNFYLFSFFVHEKQILLPMIIFGLLQFDTFKHYFTVMNLVAMFSMWLLTVNNKSSPAYIGLMVLWYFLFRPIESLNLQGFRLSSAKDSRLLIYNDDCRVKQVED